MAKSKISNERRRKVIDHAEQYGMVINPGVGYEYYLENWLKYRSCVCDRFRPECPCPESVEEVARDGWCECRLYFRDLKTYKESHVPVEKEMVKERVNAIDG